MNENLEKENVAIKGGAPTSDTSDEQMSCLHDDVRRLQAQNSALQKNLSCEYLPEK